MSVPGVFIAGIALLVAGWLTGIGILWILGIVCLVAALCLFLFYGFGHYGGYRSRRAPPY